MQKKIRFSFAFLSFFHISANKNWRSYSVSAKKEASFFVLRSTFRKFAGNNLRD
jgi:hypothetical protein